MNQYKPRYRLFFVNFGKQSKELDIQLTSERLGIEYPWSKPLSFECKYYDPANKVIVYAFLYYNTFKPSKR